MVSNEKIFVSFVYRDNNRFILVVPDIQGSMVIAKTQSEVVRKAIRNLQNNFKEEIRSTSPNPIEYFSSNYKNDYIPKDSILFPLPIKMGKRVKKFKRFTSSMDEDLLKEIEIFTKNKKMKKSDFFAQASIEFMQK